MKSFILLLFILATVQQLFSYGITESEVVPDLQFAILIKKADESWYRKEAEGFKDRCDELGVSTLIMDNHMDSNITLVNMDLAIEKNVDAVAIIIPDRMMGPVIVDRAFESDTAIISIDHKLIDHQGRQLAPHIGPDDASAGYNAGVWLAGRTTERSWYGGGKKSTGVAALTVDSIPEYRIRVDECKRALFEWLPGLGELNYHRIEMSGAGAVDGLLVMQQLLNIHPEITNWIVIAPTDESAIGAVRSLEQIGLGEHSIACGIQAERAFEEFAREKESAFIGAVYYNPYEIGRRAAELLFNFVAEASMIPAETSVPFRLISRETYGREEE